ncbi:hypothetical protein [Nonomuraea soli]|uniref:PqqD family protein n=1 Tax=Nonomuraea soli TaxID=1032476 RepID=A0A7W0HVE2_9ACTN|nr:hypothetical protein [Nonomuraea soli]MBA2896932.1 hypothetical protein [Nonomuraea soli]
MNPHPGATVEFHPLGWRRDGDDWIVGRVDSGDFVAVPEEGLRAVLLLERGATVGETERVLDLDAADLVTELCRAGLVRTAGGVAVPAPDPIRATFPRLRRRHVRWALHPLLPALLAVPILSGLLHLDRVPGWEQLIWSANGTLVLVTWTALLWSLVGLHEVAHLVTARAAGVPARISLGTRLQFLVAQTDVSGIWLAPRRVRITVYLSGIAVDLAVAGLALTFADLHPLLATIVLLQLGRLLAQLLVFMRTDLYFLLQDLTGCRDLYGDASRYLRALLCGRTGTLGSLPGRERASLRLYAALLPAGTLACLGFAIVVTLPLMVTLITGALATLAATPGPLAAADALLLLTLVIGPEVLWARAWWRRHGPRVRAIIVR